MTVGSMMIYKKTENIDYIQGEKPGDWEHGEKRDFIGYLLDLEV